ncbi:hypothetical protein EDB85DRAFT_1889581 [Lactarius pseudohatsudake]|nr:hypothetical protein EDB85DRAFT_1889581 [Lactarius pseudohatsudake]
MSSRLVTSLYMKIDIQAVSGAILTYPKCDILKERDSLLTVDGPDEDRVSLGSRLSTERANIVPHLRGFGCESAQGIVQASAGCELSYMGPLRLRTRRYRMVRAARECGEVGNGNGAGWSQVVGNGRARFGTARNFVEVATGVGNALGSSR